MLVCIATIVCLCFVLGMLVPLQLNLQGAWILMHNCLPRVRPSAWPCTNQKASCVSASLPSPAREQHQWHPAKFLEFCRRNCKLLTWCNALPWLSLRTSVWWFATVSLQLPAPYSCSYLHPTHAATCTLLMQLPTPYSFGSTAINCYSSIVCITLQYSACCVRCLRVAIAKGIYTCPIVQMKTLNSSRWDGLGFWQALSLLASNL